MKYPLSLMMLGISAAAYAVLLGNWLIRLGLGWSGLALILVALAYFLKKPEMLGKRADGHKPIWSSVLYLPIYVVAWVTLSIYKLTTREAAASEIMPGLWLGSRMWPRRLLSIRPDWVGVVDLAAEFPRSAPASLDYLSLPVLDGTSPSAAQLHRGVEWIKARSDRGPILVHCALGHGRSAALVAAYLLDQDPSQTVSQVIDRLRHVRPGVYLNADQTRQLSAMFSG